MIVSDDTASRAVGFACRSGPASPGSPPSGIANDDVPVRRAMGFDELAAGRVERDVAALP